MYKKWIFIFGLGALFLGNNILVSANKIDNYTYKQKSNLDDKVNEIIKNLKTGSKISHFFTQKVHFIYHEDNRSTGSTDGEIRNIDRKYLDEDIIIKVKTDGKGWEFNKEAVKTYLLKFNLLKKIKTWDRIEHNKYDDSKNTNTAYISGLGESDYLVLHFNKKKQIYKVEYRSEDPG